MLKKSITFAKKCMDIIDENYDTFLNKEILLLSSYDESTKSLSFSFRYGRESQNVFAYVSLKIDDITGQKGHGIRILEIKNEDFLMDERFFDRLSSIVKYWINDGVRQFDYLWFYKSDISQDYINRLCEYISFESCETQNFYICYIGNDR